jgi:hypothetical protein
MPTPFQFILLALASLRLTHFIVFDRLGHVVRSPLVDENDKPNLRGFWHHIGEGITCYWCCGMWCAIGLYITWLLLPNILQPIIIILAIGGIQATIESWVQRNIA